MHFTSLAFEAPAFLLLAVFLPLVWWFSRHSLSGMPFWRRSLVTGMRMLVALALIVCLAEPQWKMIHNQLAVMFLLDGSSSIQPEEQEAALEYINQAVRTQRQPQRNDRAGLITFGQQATIEVPALEESWWLDRLEADHNPRFTNLASAMELAAATFPPGYARRIVIVSDGNENIGSARLHAERLLRDGIGVDVVPISYRRTSDVAVEKIVTPTEVLPSAPFDLRVVLRNASADRIVAGKLQITREIGGNQQLLTEQAVSVRPGKQVFAIRQQIEQAGFFTYQATFVPDAVASDSFTANNRATAYSQVRGEAQVLLIENAEELGRFDGLVNFLREQKLDVTLRNSSAPYSNLADLQQYDSVILADVPRVSGESVDQLTQFSDEQIRALVQNTQQFGCGLVVLGGPNSYGAGGWANTELEEALPVDFEIKNAKVQAVGALVLVIDKSGSMSGEKIKWCKASAAASARMLTSRDYIGVVAFDSESRWVVPMGRNNNPDLTINRLRTIDASGGTNLMPGMEQAFQALNRVEASVKHVIVLTDGQTPPDNHLALADQMHQQGITISSVAIGQDADRRLLADIALQGGGKFYQVNDPRAIPRIFMRETRRVAMPLVYENRNGFVPLATGAGEIMRGIDDPIPPLTGFVLTTRKQSPLVEVLLRAPNQPNENDTLLATWQNGLGRCAVLTTDIGQRWAKSWPEWASYDKLMLQTVRWSLRASQGNAQLRLESSFQDNAIEVTVNALDENDAMLNFLALSGSLIDPAGEVRPFALEQNAPGRYTAHLPTGQSGNYYLAISAGREFAPLRTAIFVPETAEFTRLESNETLLRELAAQVPQGGQPGAVIQSSRGISDTETLLATNLFRDGVAPAEDRRSVWPWLLVIACAVFLGDVTFRRVSLPTELGARMRNWFRTNRAEPSREEAPLERLKQRKAEVQLAHAATASNSRRNVFEPADSSPPNQQATGIAAEANLERSSPTDQASGTGVTPGEADALDYTARLLRAKHKATRREP